MKYAAAWLLALALATPAAAQTYPDKQLQTTQQDLKNSQAEERAIQQKREKLQGELDTLKLDLKQKAALVVANEKSLQEAEEKLRVLEAEAAQKNEHLKTRSVELKAMVSAAIRLSQSPPEAALMMPEDFMETLKASRTLNVLTGTIRREAEKISDELKELEALKNKVERNRRNVMAQQARLKSEQETLDGKLERRQQLSEELRAEEEKMHQRVVRLSQESKSLQELVKNLEAERKKQEAAAQKAEAERLAKEKAAAEAAAKAKQLAEEQAKSEEVTVAVPETPAPATKIYRAKKAPKKLRSIKRAKGALAMPLGGKLTQSYGQKLHKNITSKGISIHGRAGSRVVAPFDGEVVFIGPFLDYGNMVILRHTDGYHTLLSGLSRTGVSVGDFLLEGEPIGVMKDASDGSELYVELRQSNHPIDPKPWFAGL